MQLWEKDCGHTENLSNGEVETDMLKKWHKDRIEGKPHVSYYLK
jgi:hypothetical protein